DLEPALFARHVAERLPPSEPGAPGATLGRMSLPELYLACACLRGAPAALSALERCYLARLPELLGYLRQSETTVDEICQLTGVKLLVHAPGGEPRIAEYKGHGPLLRWIQVTAARVALTLRGRERPLGDCGADVLDRLPAPGVDVELDLIERRHHAECREALREAFGSLP